MDEERKKAIQECQMPRTTKQMQSFLGAALFLMPFLGNFSDLAGPLYKMTKKDFDWNVKSWTRDYPATFEEIKAALQEAMEIIFRTTIWTGS